MKSSIVSVVCFGGMFLGASGAQADTRTASGETGGATLSALPAGTIAPPPRGRAPRMIPGSERVPGFFVYRPGASYARGDYVILAANERAARGLTERRFMREGGVREGCFAQAQTSGASPDDVEAEWMPMSQSTVTLNAGSQGRRSEVQAFHSERLVSEEGRTSLEVVDAWVDPATRGVRLIGKSTVPLTKLASFAAHDVYGVRDRRGVHVILTSARDGDNFESRAFAITERGVAQSGCSHLRVRLDAERGQGEVATFIDNVRLPSFEPHAEVRAKSEERPEQRFRPVHVHASVSWTSRDREPLLTVSAGWDAREQSRPVF